jgi:FtsP/CotA-like multicopper oxidase with cupredoxin domain
MRFSITSRNLLTILLLYLFCSNVLGQNVPTEKLVENPEEFVWTENGSPGDPEHHFSGVMEVGEATFTINGETFTTRAYRQDGGGYSIPGPTMKVVPGNKYVLSLHNTLPYEPKSEDHNVFKDPNVSNMHTHGLHISGESPSDDVTRSFEGGRGGDFVYDIPLDHMGGTYWYHAHHHGSTFLQVAGGLFGMLIVDDGLDQIPATVAAMEEREIILGYLDPAAAGTGGDVIMNGTLSATWTVNGLVEGNIVMPPDTWQHWRVLLADRAANMKTVEFGPGVEVMLLARDGVWRTVAPKEITTNQQEMTGASRADFAIRATADSWIKVGGTTVANIYIDGQPDNLTAHPFALDGVSVWSAERPEYLRDLRGELNVNMESVSMGARTINGSKYNKDVPTFSLPNTQVQEWKLSGAVQHPFHLHVYHVQALKTDNGFEEGEYYDVVSSKMSVRFDLNSASSTVYDGRTILHCHILSHEDRGAMGWLDVTGNGQGPPTYPDNTYSEYYTLNGTSPPPTPPTNLSATATSNSAIDLAWTDNSFDEEGFDIERSTDGTVFTPLASVGTNAVVYTDTGLTASTTYWYRVSAYNSNGDSAYTNIANATTQQSGGGVEMHVENITVSKVPLNGNRFRADATITILDGSDQPVSAATVNGSFTGPTTSSESGTTNNSGEVLFSSSATRNPVGEWCFEVTDVILTGATYDSGANIVTIACEGGFMSNNESAPADMLLSVYPNPSQKSTQIAFELPQKMQVVLEVYTVLGRRVAVITERSYEAGRHVLDWDARKLNSGMYFLKIKADGELIDTQRLLLMH